MPLFWIVWLGGAALAGGCYAYECKVRGNKFDGDVVWGALFLWWLMLACMIGSWLAQRVIDRSASADRNPKGQDAVGRLGAEHESAAPEGETPGLQAGEGPANV